MASLEALDIAYSEQSWPVIFFDNKCFKLHGLFIVYSRVAKTPTVCSRDDLFGWANLLVGAILVIICGTGRSRMTHMANDVSILGTQ